jgi:hypothetical protein
VSQFRADDEDPSGLIVADYPFVQPVFPWVFLHHALHNGFKSASRDSYFTLREDEIYKSHHVSTQGAIVDGDDNMEAFFVIREND